jgi:7-cyano-7-deazaguanine synthase
MAVILLSGGLDSATALAWALRNLAPPHTCISFDYGQRHDRELLASQDLCSDSNLAPPQLFYMQNVFSIIGGSSLTSGVPRCIDAFPATFVPGRNLIMLSIAAGYAYTRGQRDIVGGWNVLDYSGYPDCRSQFLTAARLAINEALGLLPEHPVLRLEHAIWPTSAMAIHAPLLHLTKAQIILMGIDLRVQFGLTWSCYAGGAEPCGSCDSCKIRAAGFEALGVPDPALRAPESEPST